MFKVMLIDDDVPVVEYIRKLVNWEALGLRICAEAYSAADAKERYEAALPDILITDIGLPDGNGMELARQFRGMHAQLRVIFLTCHEDFQFVKEALRIDADDYVVKDELSPEKITESLEKAISKLSNEQEQLEQMAYKSDLARNKDILLQQFFHELSHTSDPSGLLEQGRRLGIDWTGSCFGAASFHVDQGDLLETYDRKNLELVHYAAYNIALELAAGTGITIFMAKDQRLWTISCEGDPAAAKASLERFIPQLREKLGEFLRVDGYASIGEDTSSLAGLGGLLGKVKELHDRLYDMDSRNEDTPWPLMNSGHSPEADASLGLEALSAKWIESLLDGNQSLAHIYLGNMKRAMRIASKDAAKTKEWLIRLVQEVSIRFGRSVPAGIQEDIAHTVRLEEAARIVRWYSERLLQDVSATSAETYETNPDIKAIHAFIREHIYRNITSIDIARHLHLNPSYFSRYFKKLTGQNFTDYVHLIKMEEAKRLLAKGETAEHTAYMLGYSDRAYFSKVFKKYTGVSPSEYKQHPLIMKE
ncbi:MULTISPECIES: response regulator transcription factor [unclassified Paenibacillus]|uniref:response regulator transcription factor n=1 Tax=unclassified Paenibacillus TaxID=185978 RepID=UPI0023799644|nr:helix-turn-helix domain-containing protein [Paenibacillus sp. MAHUQ-63]